MGKEQDNNYYNKVFEVSQTYKNSYKTSHYFEGWQKSLNWINISQNKKCKVLDIGCGPGQFAEMLLDHGVESYRGFDFSNIAIDIAKKRIPKWNSNFQVSDIFTTDILDKEEYDVVCIFEVLEHINNDIDCLNKIKAGAIILLSVPNFWDPAHVRIFDSIDKVIERYQEIIQIQDTFEVTRSPAKWFYLKGIKK
jgi:2-polyprenyl-3-methyl-5-hydroxy-6-metoxy-1,4-benzoquinol methylase